MAFPMRDLKRTQTRGLRCFFFRRLVGRWPRTRSTMLKRSSDSALAASKHSSRELYSSSVSSAKTSPIVLTDDSSSMSVRGTRSGRLSHSLQLSSSSKLSSSSSWPNLQQEASSLPRSILSKSNSFSSLSNSIMLRDPEVTLDSSSSSEVVLRFATALSSC